MSAGMLAETAPSKHLQASCHVFRKFPDYAYNVDIVNMQQSSLYLVNLCKTMCAAAAVRVSRRCLW